MKGIRATVNRMRLAAGRLPRSFVPDGAAADLFPDYYSAAKSFFEISEQSGLKEAKHIFAETIRRATQAKAMRPPRPKRPPPKKTKGSYDRPGAALLLGAWEIYRAQNPAASKEDFGRWWEASELRKFIKDESKKAADNSESDVNRLRRFRKIALLSNPGSVVRRLNRLLANQSRPVPEQTSKRGRLSADRKGASRSK